VGGEFVDQRCRVAVRFGHIDENGINVFIVV